MWLHIQTYFQWGPKQKELKSAHTQKGKRQGTKRWGRKKKEKQSSKGNKLTKTNSASSWVIADLNRWDFMPDLKALLFRMDFMFTFYVLIAFLIAGSHWWCQKTWRHRHVQYTTRWSRQGTVWVHFERDTRWNQYSSVRVKSTMPNWHCCQSYQLRKT